MKLKKPLILVVSLCVLMVSSAFMGSNQWFDRPSPVILISFDGFMNEYLQQYREDGTFNNRGFGRIFEEGTVAESMQVSLPSLTATSHISIVTGVDPSEHGIVSNRYHKVTDPIHKETIGFDATISAQTPTLWERALADGKKVGVIAYPGVDGKGPRRTADFGVNYTKREVSPFLARFTSKDFQDHPHVLPKNVKTYSKPLKTKLILQEKAQSDDDNTEQVSRHPFHVLAIDTTDDNAKNYNALIFDRDTDLSNGFIGVVDLEDQPWIGLHFKSKGLVKGAYCKLISLKADVSEMSIYVGGLYATKAYPKEFQELLIENQVFWPGAPDRGGEAMTHEMKLEQAVRYSEFFKKATLLGAKNFEYDLILSYQPIIDEMEHSFLMVDERQKDYSEETSNYFLDLIHRGYLQANQVVEDIMNAQPETNLFIVSDHGMAPIHSVVFPNRLLLDHNYIVQGPQGNKHKARAFASGGLAHVYVNLQGREPGGTVPKSQYDRVVKELIELYSTAKHQDGEVIFSKVFTREQATKYGLNHPNSGDVIVVATPGYHLSNDFGKGPAVEQASFYGQHGYDPALDEMKAIFAAWGPDIHSENIGHISFKEILPRILEVLN